MAQQAQLTDNQELLDNSQGMFWGMPPVPVTTAGQVLDIELDSLGGYMDTLDLDCKMAVNITMGGTSAPPSLSQFAPYNIFSKIEVSLGGGAFISVNPYFFYLRDMVTHRGWTPDKTILSPAYAASTHYSMPAISAPSSTTTENVWRFPIHIPLQAIPKQVWGHIPLGTSAVKCKIRLTVTNTLYGTDQYVSPLYGGTNVTSAAISNVTASYVAPNIDYKMPHKAGIKPSIGWLLNVQERAFGFVGAGSNNPLKFPDPYQYMRLWMLVIDGTGAPNTTGVTNLELDPMPGFARKLYNSPSSLAKYFQGVRRLYETDLPTGVFLFDLNTDVHPVDGDGNQNINGVDFQTLQTQIAVSGGTNVAAPARIITYAETFQPIAF